MGDQHSCLANWFIGYMKMKKFLEAGCCGNLLGVPLFRMSLVWALACCWPCALFPKGVGAPHLLVMFPLVSLRQQLTVRICPAPLCSQDTVLLSCYSTSLFPQHRDPLWGSTQHVIAFRVVCAPCPALPLNGQYGSVQLLQIKPHFFQRYQKIPSWKKACVNWRGSVPIYIKGKLRS